MAHGLDLCDRCATLASECATCRGNWEVLDFVLEDTRAWQVYIDNLELQLTLPRSEAEQLRGTISKDPTAVTVAYDYFGSPGADEKEVLRNLGTVTLGVRILGNLGRLEPSCAMRLVSLTFFVLTQRTVPRKHWQIVPVGRRNLRARVEEVGTEFLLAVLSLGEVIDELILSCILAPLGSIRPKAKCVRSGHMF